MYNFSKFILQLFYQIHDVLKINGPTHSQLKKKTVLNIQVLCMLTLTFCLELTIQELANCVIHILENSMFIF